MKRKLIETHQEDLIVCDNPNCDFKIPNPTGDINEPSAHYINVACPNCGQNLLSEEDFLASEKMRRSINWVNKWFSWLTFFQWTKRPMTVRAHFHKGVKLEREK